MCWYMYMAVLCCKGDEGMAIYYGDASGKAQEVLVVGKPGPAGPQGPQGETGPQGPAGQGVPTGGTAGQVLTKIDGVAYNANWQTPKVSAENVASGVLPTEVKASAGTDYAVSRLRNIRASTTDLTAGSSPLANGEIYLVYE